jgi:predicted PolB exonuclease-like 3'-5' exonuclease
MNSLVFDIETIPDINAGRRLYHLDLATDAEIAQAMFAKRAAKTGGSDFLKHHVHRVVAISVVLRQADRLKVWSIGDPNSSEKEIIERFFEGIERYTPTLVSWNGSGFDLPVLHYRAMLHGISAPRYWETGDQDSNFKWNNYLSRFHQRHTDLMDVLSGYQARAVVPLDEMASLLGFPGKTGMNGAHVWQSYLDGKIVEIRNYCETDVLNTHLVYLRFQLMQGKLSTADYQREYQLVMDTLNHSEHPHLKEFAAACKNQLS